MSGLKKGAGPTSLGGGDAIRKNMKWQLTEGTQGRTIFSILMMNN